MLKNAISMHSDAVFGSKNVQYSCSEYETFVKHRIFQKWVYYICVLAVNVANKKKAAD